MIIIFMGFMDQFISYPNNCVSLWENDHRNDLTINLNESYVAPVYSVRQSTNHAMGTAGISSLCLAHWVKFSADDILRFFL